MKVKLVCSVKNKQIDYYLIDARTKRRITNLKLNNIDFYDKFDNQEVGLIDYEKNPNNYELEIGATITPK